MMHHFPGMPTVVAISLSVLTAVGTASYTLGNTWGSSSTAMAAISIKSDLNRALIAEDRAKIAELQTRTAVEDTKLDNIKEQLTRVENAVGKLEPQPVSH